MYEPTAILQQTKLHVQQLLAGKLPPWVRYHRPEHTEETVRNALHIGSGVGLQAAEMEIVELAAWFHDVGYVDRVEGHEERSVELARKFLSDAGYPAEKIDRVIGCIRATRVPQLPSTIEEQVLCDADLLHLGTEEFFHKGELLKEEIQLRSGRQQDRREWLRVNLEFLNQHPFHTAFARRTYGPRREENIREVEGRLRDHGNRKTP